MSPCPYTDDRWACLRAVDHLGPHLVGPAARLASAADRLERYYEDRLRRSVAAVGGLTLKVPPVVAGPPDRLVILPGQPPAFVELKRPSGRLSPVQARFHARLADLGSPVVVLYGDEVDGWPAAQVRAFQA